MTFKDFNMPLTLRYTMCLVVKTQTFCWRQERLINDTHRLSDLRRTIP